MLHRRGRLLALFVLPVLFLVASCDINPVTIEQFKQLDPASQAVVLNHIATEHNAAPTDCNTAIDRHWPGDKAWAKRIVWRESRNTPTARNASGASGCFQMMLPLHSRRFSAVGCSPAAWADPVCNVRAAWTLYAEAGTSPWALTNY